jgi:hypothetical protein
MKEEHCIEELLPFHLGALDDPERADIETHLASCQTCLGSLFALLRQVDRATTADERPSPAVRRRLRKAIARRLAPREQRRLRIAVGAALAAAMLLALLWSNRPRLSRAPDHQPTRTLIDVGSDPQALRAL